MPKDHKQVFENTRMCWVFTDAVTNDGDFLEAKTTLLHEIKRQFLIIITVCRSAQESGAQHP